MKKKKIKGKQRNPLEQEGFGKDGWRRKKLQPLPKEKYRKLQLQIEEEE